MIIPHFQVVLVKVILRGLHRLRIFIGHIQHVIYVPDVMPVNTERDGFYPLLIGVEQGQLPAPASLLLPVATDTPTRPCPELFATHSLRPSEFIVRQHDPACDHESPC